MEKVDKEFKNIIIKIEKVRHELDVNRASINSWNWNLANPKASNEDREMFSERLAEDLNNRTKLQKELEELTYVKLTNKMKELNMPGNGKDYLKAFDKVKRKNDSPNFYVQARDEKIQEPTKVQGPSEPIKKQIYELYCAIYKSTLSPNKKEKMLNSIFGYEPWSWRVVGISKNAIREFAKNNFNYKSGTFQRDHHFQPRYVTLRKMLENIMPYDKWWPWFWDNDRTLLVTKEEHNKKSYDPKKDIISIDWQLGYFESGATMGFNYKKKNEGKFIEGLAKEHKIK